MNESDHKGGRLAANFRRANISEGLAVQMLRPFAAIAQVPREEDFGIDLIATLLRREGRCLNAEDSFVVQVKTHTAARFEFEGDGVRWLRALRLPYFPVVANLEKAEVSLFTLNRWQWVIHSTIVDKYVFVVTEDDLDEDPGDDFFFVGEPLMRWSIADCADPQFAEWAYSILKPVVRIETTNQEYGPVRRFIELVGGPYEFKDRSPDGVAIDPPPKAGDVREIPPGGRSAILEALRCVLGPFANLVSNDAFPDDRSADLLRLRESFRRLGFDPDPKNRWEIIAQEMAEYARKPPAAN